MNVPPPPSEYLAGTVLYAGMGCTLVLPSMDFETYSEAGHVWNPATNKWDCPEGAKKKGLSTVGVVVYAEHPSAKVLTLTYDLKDGRGRRRWNPTRPNPQELFDYLASGGLISGWNIAFEYWIWTLVCVKKYGWPPLNPNQLRCTMAKSRAHALPGSLENAGTVLNSDVQKDKRGTALLNKFSVPRNPTKGDPSLVNALEKFPAEAEELFRYCDQDVASEGFISNLIPDLIPDEEAYWLVDQAINRRGVAIDVNSVENCIEIINQAHSRYNTELYQLTDGQVARASELAKLQEWLHGLGVHCDSLDEEHLDAALKLDLPPKARRALEIRAAIGSAAVKKVFAMRNQVSSQGRLHGLFAYHAARTGRATGNGPQPTNLPNSGPEVFHCFECDSYYGTHHKDCPSCGTPALEPAAKKIEWEIGAAEYSISLIEKRSLGLLEYYFGDALSIVSGCLRGLFVAGEGKDLVCSDYSAIEAVVTAFLSGCEWRKDVFRTHGKIYEMSAALMSGIPLEVILQYKKDTGNHHPLRKKGKIAELALGFGGWVGAMIQFGAADFMTEQEMKDAILAWRAASPEIMEMLGGQWRCTQDSRGYNVWTQEYYGLEGAAVQAVLNPGQVYGYAGITYQMYGDALYCTLLSGRKLTYHRPRLARTIRFKREMWALSYEGWNSNPKNGPTGWIRMDTYSGKLGENVVQATAADILRHASKNAELRGYHIVLHVYDEVVAEIPKGWGSIEELEQIMSTMPPWAADWPIKAQGGWRGYRYRK